MSNQKEKPTKEVMGDNPENIAKELKQKHTKV